MNKKIIYGISILVSISLLSALIFQLIDVSQKKYFVGVTQEENQEIQKEISKLRVSLSENTHLENFEGKVLEEGFEKVGKIEYIRVSANGELASR